MLRIQVMHMSIQKKLIQKFCQAKLKSEKKTWRNFHLMILCRGLEWRPIKVFTYQEALRQQMKMGRNRISVPR